MVDVCVSALKGMHREAERLASLYKQDFGMSYYLAPAHYIDEID